ncbi:MAG TPA: type II TA system antitoxin MqsA family protein [Acidobacteriota bacterium]
MKCPECGSELVLGRNQKYRYVESGLDNVYLTGLNVRRCPNCKTRIPEIPNIRDVHLCIALWLVEKPAPLSGKEIRFLRKSLGIKSKEFAKKLGYTSQAFSRIEKGKSDIGKQGDRLVRIWFLAQKEADLAKYRSILEPMKNFDKIGTSLSKAPAIFIDVYRVDEACNRSKRDADARTAL